MATDRATTTLRFRDRLDRSTTMETDVLNGFVGRRLRAAQYVQRTAGHTVVPGSIDHTLVFRLGGGRARRFDGARQTGQAEGRHTTTLIPAQATYGWELPDDSSVLHMYVDDADLRRFAHQEFDIDPDRLEMRDYMGQNDPFMHHLGPLVLQELQSDLPQSHLLLDGFDGIIAGHMLRAYSNVPDIAKPSRVGLADRDAQAIARARDVLLDSLSRNIPIETLAREVGVSPFRLMRCFKAEMGQTIHQFVIEHRVAFVRDRISRSDDPLAQIAFDAGFANQSHMTSAYTAMMGISPGKHRRELRG